MTVATFEDNTLTIAATGQQITVSAIAWQWNTLSHYPERRAAIELRDLAARLNEFGEYVGGLAAQAGQIDPAAEIARFTARHVTLTRRAWAMDARCASSFIVGPAKFPTERNRKRMDWADGAYKAIREHVGAARKAAQRAAFPYGAPGEAIRSNNPDAPDLIRAEIEKRRAAHAQMKAVNAAIRSVKSGDEAEMVQAVVDVTGWRASLACKVVAPPQAWMGRGFAAYQLSGELAEIKRLEARLKTIEANRERGAIETEHNTTEGRLRIVENGDAARIQLFFDGKPEPKTRDTLKGNGFRWAPSEGAWQRHLNSGGRYAAQRVLSALQMETATA